MATQTRYPRSANAVLGAGWKNIGNLLLNDEVYATATGSSCSSNFYDFGFNIPTGSTINSITVTAERMVSSTDGTHSYLFSTRKNGSAVGTDVSSTNEPTYDIGMTKTLNGTWTADELNDNTVNGFCCYVEATSSNAAHYHYLDFILVTVNYTPPYSVTKYPQSVAAVLGAGWQNTGNIATNNGSYATATGLSCASNFYNFDFGIPSNATIWNIIVTAERKVSTDAGTHSYLFSTRKEGVSVGTDAGTYSTEPLSDTLMTKVENGTWTAAELNDNTADGFCCYVEVSSSTASDVHYLDFINAYVEYTVSDESYNGSFAQII